MPQLFLSFGFWASFGIIWNNLDFELRLAYFGFNYFTLLFLHFAFNARNITSLDTEKFENMKKLLNAVDELSAEPCCNGDDQRA